MTMCQVYVTNKSRSYNKAVVIDIIIYVLICIIAMLLECLVVR